MIGIIDYGAGNIGNVKRAFNYLGVETKLIESPHNFHGLSALILPGVGSFGGGMEGLRTRKLVKPIKNHIREGRPFLGICLGLQLLFDSSEENPEEEGLGILPGECKRFNSTRVKRVPQIGWNNIQLKKSEKLLAGLPDNYLYFVHSYFIELDSDLTIASAIYGDQEFTAVLKQDNIFAIQPHPEKSGRTGLKILQNFLEVIE
ncbi:MAG: imidazole glycerol phosphate synthase subunit HisH [Bacillota bacterium]